MTTQQPEALDLANWLDAVGNGGISSTAAAVELRRQHARIAKLEAQLESIAASAGSEPVAHLWQHCETGRTRIVMPDMIVDADASWQVVGPLCLGATPPTAQAEGWTRLPGALPKPGTPVLLDIGKKYPIRAMWAAKHTVQAADDDTDWGEYVDADDMYYAPEGWYEWNECEDNHWRVTETPRAWAPLPPTTSAGSGKGGES